ncbi:hypothetical protein FQZ97_679150 [compost metagenome]
MLMPALAAQAWAWNIMALTPCGAVIAISDAPGLFRCSKLARNTLKVPSRSMSTTVLNALADMSTTGARKLPAAPEITTSIGPSSWRVRASAASTAA